MASKGSSSPGGAKKGEFTGPLQPHKSKLPESRVWALARRPGPGHYSLPGTIGVKVHESGISTGPSPAFRLTSHEGANVLPSWSVPGTMHHDDGSCTAMASPKTVISTKATAPRAGFGTSKREHSAATYTSFTYAPSA